MIKIIYFDFWGTMFDGQAMVPGMVEVVRELAQGQTLVVVSSAGTKYVRGVLEQAGIAERFLHIFGGDLGKSKAEVMAELDQHRVLGPQTLSVRSIMVTDTADDVRQALAVGVRPIGVAWGNQSTEDLHKAGAETVVQTPQEIIDQIKKSPLL